MKQIRFKFDHWYPKMVGMGAVTIYPFILIAASANKVNIELIRHEMIHVRQVREIGWTRFYASYFRQIATGLIRRRDFNMAYLENAFEAEAYDHQKDPFTQAEKDELIAAGVRLPMTATREEIAAVLDPLLKNPPF